MSSLRFVFLFSFSLFISSATFGGEVPKLTSTDWAQLQKGSPVLFTNNPACPSSKDKTYVNGALIIRKTPSAVWNVLQDPEAAPSYIDELKSAKILSVRGKSLFVEQGMQVKGFGRLCKYVVRMDPTPGQKIIFQFESGKLRAMDGGWWLYPINKGTETLLVYSIFLDPGRLAPQTLVRSSLQKKIPQTLVAVRGEVIRRANTVAKR